MIGKVFHSVRNLNDLTAIRANNRAATVILVYKSPYATQKENYRLEQKLLRIYTQYYLHVNFETLGQFWKEEEPTISVKYPDEVGGFPIWNE